MSSRIVQIAIVIFLILGLTNLFVKAAPPLLGLPLFLENLCDYECPRHFSPVCAVDSSGVPRTFGNRCFADLMYCIERRYYAVVKQGEC